jgi:quercetin dioxygenase-like cupin family protein
MNDQIRQIAGRIREMREITGISAETIALKLGVTPETYLNYESGNSDIPIGIILSCSELFHVEMSVLLGGDNPRLHVYSVVRKGHGLKLERRKQYEYESLAFNFVNNKSEVFIVTVAPRESDEFPEYSSHPGQEFNYVIEGTLMTIIDGHEIILRAGDSVYFDSGYRHAMRALNNETVKFLAVVL